MRKMRNTRRNDTRTLPCLQAPASSACARQSKRATCHEQAPVRCSTQTHYTSYEAPGQQLRRAIEESHLAAKFSGQRGSYGKIENVEPVHLVSDSIPRNLTGRPCTRVGVSVVVIEPDNEITDAESHEFQDRLHEKEAREDESGHEQDLLEDQKIARARPVVADWALILVLQEHKKGRCKHTHAPNKLEGRRPSDRVQGGVDASDLRAEKGARVKRRAQRQHPLSEKASNIHFASSAAVGRTLLDTLLSLAEARLERRHLLRRHDRAPQHVKGDDLAPRAELDLPIIIGDMSETRCMSETRPLMLAIHHRLCRTCEAELCSRSASRVDLLVEKGSSISLVGFSV